MPDDRLTPQELEDVLMALRGQAWLARKDAETNAGSSTAGIFIRKAERLEALIAKFERVLAARSA
jgi:hypothetical protein